MTKYPIILVHGVALRESKAFHAFGRIEKMLTDEGYTVYTAGTDAFGTVESNAEQLKNFILTVLSDTECEKVNVIAHSKGGLDTKYMLSNLDMAKKVASLTTLCTPHKGSQIATKIWTLPLFIKKFLAFFINGFYKIIGDKNPDSLKVCEQLKLSEIDDNNIVIPDEVYCQSYSTKLKKGSDCILMGVPMKIYRMVDGSDNDGMVSEESSKFGNYRGECIDDSISHTQIVDILAKRKNRKKIFEFYVNVCRELTDMGF